MYRRTVGVLALQGGFQPHLDALAALGHHAIAVRTADELAMVHGLVLPGGESSTQLKLIERHDLGPALRRLVSAGHPVLATCAGLILAAKKVVAPEQPSFGWLDVMVERNAFGRQLDSFEGLSDDHNLHLVFIRAPRIVEVGPRATVLARFNGEPVLIRQANVVGASFHPELTPDASVHAMVFGTPEEFAHVA
jgi:5'-phosphate synthase pdxT subunit